MTATEMAWPDKFNFPPTHASTPSTYSVTSISKTSVSRDAPCTSVWKNVGTTGGAHTLQDDGRTQTLVEIHFSQYYELLKSYVN